MKWNEISFEKGKRAVLAACTIALPDGFSVTGGKKTFTAWLPDRENPRDPEASRFVIAPSVYEPYEKGSMDGITARSIGKYTEYLAAKSENDEEDEDAKQKYFAAGNVTGTYNIVRFSGSRNFYPTAWLPEGRQQFHIRVNDPTIPEEKVMAFITAWMETLEPEGAWKGSTKINDAALERLPLTQDTIDTVKANIEKRMGEENTRYALAFRTVQENITTAARTGKPDGEEIMQKLQEVREEYAASIDTVIEESADYLRAVSAQNPGNELLYALVDAIREANPMEQVVQNINGTEYTAKVSLAGKKDELFMTPEIRAMEEEKEKKEKEAEAERAREIERQKAAIGDKIEQLNREKEELLQEKERQKEGLSKKKEEFFAGLPDIDEISRKMQEQSSVITSLTARKEHLGFLQRKKKREAEKQIAENQEVYGNLKDSLYDARKQRQDKNRAWDEIVTLEKGKTQEIDSRIAELDRQIGEQNEALEDLNG